MYSPAPQSSAAAVPSTTKAQNQQQKWLARVNHRASHIANAQNSRPSTLSTITDTGPARHSGSVSFPLRVKPATTLQSRFGSQGSADQPSALRQTSSYPASPVSPTSPTDTEFAATPIEANFGDRVEQKPAELPSIAFSSEKVRSRSGTLTKANTLPDGKMDKFARQAGDNTYDSDAEADDEFERSVFSSPIIAGHFADDHSDHPSDSEDDHSLADGEDTPTTQGWTDRDGRSPTRNISQWTDDDTAEYIASLSPALKQYSAKFIEEGVDGLALISLHHDELKELGVASAGHRLTILKAVYEQKRRSGVKIEEMDYVPLSAEAEMGEMNATQDDIARIIESLRLRDQRIVAMEGDLRVLKQDLDRISDENRKLREETLPIMRLVKDQRTPLPDPSGGTIPSPRDTDPSRQQEFPGQKSSGLSRKFSTKKLFLKSTDPTKQPSPTHPPQSHTPQPREVRDDGGAHLEASAAAMAASSHLTASITSQTSPNSIQGQQLSPTSPAYSTHQAPASAGIYAPPGSSTSRSFPREANSSRQEHRAGYGHTADDTRYSDSSHWSNASTIVADQENIRTQDRSRRQAPTPSPREDQAPTSSRDRDNPQVEIFKKFRVSIEDPCRMVLPVALKRYNINEDWRGYALYIVHGDQERCLGLEEKPLLLFKQLDKEGRQPMFMLRKHASPQEGWSGTRSAAGPPTSDTKQIPGGVL